MSAEPDDVDFKLALGTALGMTIDEACQYVGLASRSTYYTRLDKHTEFYEKVRLTLEPIAEMTFALRVGAGKAAMKAEDKLASRLDGALKIHDKVVDHLTADDNAGVCHECGRLEPATLKELLSAYSIIVPFIARYSASAMPTKIQLSGEVLHGHVLIQNDTVDSLTSFLDHMKSVPALMAPDLALPPAIEVHAEPESASP